MASVWQYSIKQLRIDIMATWTLGLLERSASCGLYVDVHNQDPNSKVSFKVNTSIELNTMTGYELDLDVRNGLTYTATITSTSIDDPKTVVNKQLRRRPS